MTLLPLMAGLALFFAAHVFTTLRDRRAAAIARMGEFSYKRWYMRVSLLGLALIIWGFVYYRNGGYIPVWEPPRWTAHITMLLMLPAMVLIVAAHLPGHIKARMRHPMLVAVKLWSLGHLLANGDLGSLLLFGSFLAYGVYDRIAVKKREAVEGMKAVDPNPAMDWLALGLGLALYAAIALWLHPILFGVPVIAGR